MGLRVDGALSRARGFSLGPSQLALTSDIPLGPPVGPDSG
jgi:hypothetical protein